MHIKLNVRCEFLGEAKERIRVRRDSQTYLTAEPFFSFFLFFLAWETVFSENY